MFSKFTWMDGQLLETAQATVPFLTPALHYGVGVFEGIRAYATPRGPAIFRAREHMARLIDSAKILGFPPLRYTVDDLVTAACDTVRANGFDECYIRPLAYLAEGGWNLVAHTGRIAVGIVAWEWKNYLGQEEREKGIRANISSFTRHHPNVTMTKAKVSGNYANSVLAKTESMKLGFEEAIMLDPQGYIAECTGENIFVVRGNTLYTPHTAPILEGITRGALAQIAADLGYTVKEAPISRDQLYIADEVFVCGTAAEVMALAEIDFRTIGQGRMGPVTRAIQQVFEAAIHGRDPRYERWLTYVNP